MTGQRLIFTDGLISLNALCASATPACRDETLPAPVLALGSRRFFRLRCSLPPTVRARVLANAAKPGVVGVEEFRPIPAVQHLGSGRMGYVGADGLPLHEDEPIRDEFVP